MDLRSTPMRTLSFASSKSYISTALRFCRAAANADSFTMFARSALQQIRRASAGFRQQAREAKAPIKYAATLSAKPAPSESIFMRPFHDGLMTEDQGRLAQPILCGPYVPPPICDGIRFPSQG